MNDDFLPFEIFAAKDSGDLILSVPCKCGLKKADTLRLAGMRLFAMCGPAILPIDFSELTEEGKRKLSNWSKSGRLLPVAELKARGLFDAYFLKIVVD